MICNSFICSPEWLVYSVSGLVIIIGVILLIKKIRKINEQKLKRKKK
jgi:hypothetical protein